MQNGEVSKHLVTLERVLSEQERLKQSMQSAEEQNSRRMRRYVEVWSVRVGYVIEMGQGGMGLVG